MNFKLSFIITLVVVGLSLSMAMPVRVEAQAVFVSELFSGSVIKVDGAGIKTVFAASLGRPGPLKFDKHGNLFVVDFNGRLLKITPTGTASTFTSILPDGGFNDFLITDDDKPFLLLAMENPATGEMTAAIWELVEGGAPILLATTVNEAPLGQNARGFTCGPGGDFYLAMQGGNGGGRIIRITRTGQVSTFFNPGFPPFNSGGGSMLDVRFNSQNDMLILGHVPPGNTRILWKVHNGTISTFVNPGGIPDQSLQLTIDNADNLFVSGGGFGGCPTSQVDCFEGFIKRVDPLGNVTTLATFPPSGGEPYNPIIDIDFNNYENLLPSVEPGGPYSVNEGGSVTVTASGSEPENGPLTYVWDLDNNGSFETPGQSVTFSAANLDGPSSQFIKVQVTDNGGLTATAETSVEVVNVAPTATFTATPSTIIAGQAVTSTFSNPFDPSAADVTNGYRYSFDCTSDGTFEISDATTTTFYTCPYPTEGVFNLTGRIKDKDGGFTDYTVQLNVLTPQDAVHNLIDQVVALNDPQGNGLIGKLNVVIARLDDNKTDKAIEMLRQFIDQVNVLIQNGTITAAEGQPLIDAANAIITALSNPVQPAAARLKKETNAASELPTEFQLAQNWPNPFNPTTTIQFSVPRDGYVRLKVYNAFGAEVATLVDRQVTAGTYNINWNAGDLASGIYLYRFEGEGFAQTKRLLLMK